MEEVVTCTQSFHMDCLESGKTYNLIKSKSHKASCKLVKAKQLRYTLREAHPQHVGGHVLTAWKNLGRIKP